MAGFAAAAAVLVLLVVAIVLLPLWRQQRISRAAVGSVLIMCIVAIPVYWQVSTWDFSRPPPVARAGQVPDIDAMVGGLEARLATDPTDVEGWTMLGRSYVVLQQYPEAVRAYREAWQRTPNPSSDLKLAFAEAQAFVDQTSLRGEAGQLVEEVLAVRPMDPRALWYGGMTAFLTGRPGDARERWTQLLSLNPPEAVADVLKAQLAQLDGGSQLATAEPATDAGAKISVAVALAEEAAAAVTSTAQVFVIARNPGGGPPIAVTRHAATALPGEFVLTDADAMLPGSSLAAFPELELVVRLSLTGDPIAKPGDWYANALVVPGAGSTRLVINQRVE